MFIKGFIYAAILGLETLFVVYGFRFFSLVLGFYILFFHEKPVDMDENQKFDFALGGAIALLLCSVYGNYLNI
jgi:hypothetical protein